MISDSDLAADWESLTESQRSERQQMFTYWLFVLESLMPELDRSKRERLAAESVAGYFDIWSLNA